MLSKRYESTEVDRRTWLHVPSGTHWSISSDTQQVVEIYKRLQLRCRHHFKSDLINNMDHMRISDNDPSPNKVVSKVENDCPKGPKTS